MCKYIESVQLRPEVHRLLIEEFGSLANAKHDFTISNLHLPENLQDKLKGMLVQEFPYLNEPSVNWKECYAEINAMVRDILAEL